MPMHFNGPKSNQIGLGFQNDPIDVQLFSLHSNFGSSTSLNELISPRSQPITSSLSQLNIGQRVTEVIRRSAYVTPRRLQVHSFIDYIPVQNQAYIPVAEISVTQIVRTEEVVRTHLLTTQIPNDHEIHIQGQPSFQSKRLTMPYDQKESFHDHHLQKYPRHDHHRSRYQNPSHIPCHFQNLHSNESNSNPLKGLIPVNTNSTSDDHDQDETDHHEEGDGRTHSLPCKKYGPYTCPKCKGVFYTSQSFAAHMGSHYKYESSAARRRRQAAKYKRKNLRLVQLEGGLTVLPVSFNTPGKRNGRRSTVHKKAHKAVKIEEKDDEVERKEEATPTELAAEEGLIDVEIKEEPMELRA
jgi:uncharacterized C2H2 Zn-finger protein